MGAKLSVYNEFLSLHFYLKSDCVPYRSIQQPIGEGWGDTNLLLHSIADQAHWYWSELWKSLTNICISIYIFIWIINQLNLLKKSFYLLKVEIYANNIIIYIQEKKNPWQGQPNFNKMRFGFLILCFKIDSSILLIWKIYITDELVGHTLLIY